VTPQASPNRSTLTWLIPITLLIAVCALVGGLIARQLYATSKPVDTKQPPAVVNTPAAPHGDPDDTTSVHYTAFAIADPNYDLVQPVLQKYFNAVNHRDFKAWRQVVTGEVGNHQTEADWRDGYKTTVDKGMFVYRIVDTDQGADVFGTFTSTQDVADAPPDLKASCIQWNVVWPIVKSSDGFRIDVPVIVSKKCDA